MKLITLILSLSACFAFGDDIDSGMRIRDSKTDNMRIAGEGGGTVTSPLRIQKEAGPMGIVLVDPSHPLASSARVFTSEGTKALKLYKPTPTPNSCVWRGAESTYGKERAMCPHNFGIFVSGNGDLLTYICCELPEENMLVGAVKKMGDTCGTNEVVVGVARSSQGDAELYCQSIDTSKYRLAASQRSCVWTYGGRHGWGRAPHCDPNPPVVAAIDPTGNLKDVGEDGCMGTPYGSLLVARKHKNCGQQWYSSVEKK